MKILASDFDNTLFFRTGFKKKDLEAIKAFQKAGHKFGVCTGRSYNGIVTPSKDYDIHYDFYIVVSGGIIKDGDGKTLYEKDFPYAIVEDCFNQFEETVSFVSGNTTYLYYSPRHQMKAIVKEMYHAMKKGNENVVLLDSLHEVTPKIPSFSIHLGHKEQEKAHQVANYINETYKDDVTAFVNDVHIDVCANGCSKGNALKWIQNYYHVDDDQVCGIGDNFNDLPLLHSATHSFTFDYAPAPVQAEAEHVVASLSEAVKLLL